MEKKVLKEPIRFEENVIFVIMIDEMNMLLVMVIIQMSLKCR